MNRGSMVLITLFCLRILNNLFEDIPARTPNRKRLIQTRYLASVQV